MHYAPIFFFQSNYMTSLQLFTDTIFSSHHVTGTYFWDWDIFLRLVMVIDIIAGWDLRIARVRRMQLALHYLKADEIEKYDSYPTSLFFFSFWCFLEKWTTLTVFRKFSIVLWNLPCYWCQRWFSKMFSPRLQYWSFLNSFNMLCSY